MQISKKLRLQLLAEVEKAKNYYLRAAQIVSEECNDEEIRIYRIASEEPAKRLQELLDALQVKT